MVRKVGTHPILNYNEVDSKMVARSRREFLDQCKSHNRDFFEVHKGKYVVVYLRDPYVPAKRSVPWISMGRPPYARLNDGRFPIDDRNHKGKPNAVMVAFEKPNGTLGYGWSAVSPGTLFIKAEGLWRAIQRATGQTDRNNSPPIRLMDAAPAFVKFATDELNKNKTMDAAPTS